MPGECGGEILLMFLAPHVAVHSGNHPIATTNLAVEAFTGNRHVRGASGGDFRNVNLFLFLFLGRGHGRVGGGGGCLGELFGGPLLVFFGQPVGGHSSGQQIFFAGGAVD